jgi:hypothetical protein
MIQRVLDIDGLKESSFWAATVRILRPAPYRVYNIGSHRPESVILVEILESCLGRKGNQAVPADAAGRRPGDPGRRR